MAKSTVYAFLPYLRTRSRCHIRGFEFRSADDIADLELSEAADIKVLSQMFYVPQGNRIATPTYAIVRGDDRQSLEQSLLHFREAQLLIGYLYGAPHHVPTYHDDTFLRAECWAAYTFVSDDMIPAALATAARDSHDERLVAVAQETTAPDDFLKGYSGLRNGIVPLWVVPESRIYPETHNVILNVSQDLGSDLSRLLANPMNWPIAELSRGTRLSPEDSKRVFTSLLWHSRSCRSAADPVERLVSLAIALETLLALEKGDRLTARFKDAVTTLVGPVPRLDEWLNQFYDARSGAVHEGQPENLVFLIPGPQKSSLPHRNLIVYARRIFRICLNAALSGMILAKKTGLPTLLVHNNERLADICSRLSASGSAENRLTSVERIIEELHECETLTMGPELEENLEKLFGATKLMVQTYLEGPRSTISGLDEHLQCVRDAKVNDDDNLLNAIDAAKQATDLLRAYVRKDRNGQQQDETILRFLEFASRPAVALHCHRLKRRSKTRDVNPR